jgi:hypothetical protein
MRLREKLLVAVVAAVAGARERWRVVAVVAGMGGFRTWRGISVWRYYMIFVVKLFNHLFSFHAETRRGNVRRGAVWG